MSHSLLHTDFSRRPGTHSSLHERAYLSNQSSIFTATEAPDQALKVLNALERLTEKTYWRDETCQFTWLNVLKANIYLELEKFSATTDYAKRVDAACQDISSVTNTAIITSNEEF